MEWIVKFTPPKTKLQLITKKKSNDTVPPMMMDENIIKEGVSHKRLEVTICKYLNWRKHSAHVATSAGRCLDVFNALKYKLDRSTWEHLYIAFISSKLEYGSIVWDICTQELSNLVENVHYRAITFSSVAIH